MPNMYKRTSAPLSKPQGPLDPVSRPHDHDRLDNHSNWQHDIHLHQHVDHDAAIHC